MHDVHTPVGGARNKDPLTEESDAERNAPRQKTGVRDRPCVSRQENGELHRRTVFFGKTFRQPHEAGRRQKKTDSGQREKVTLPPQVRRDPAADDGRHRGAEPEDHRHVGHQFLSFGAAVEVADHRHADHHAAAGKNPLDEAKTNHGFQGR